MKNQSITLSVNIPSFKKKVIAALSLIGIDGRTYSLSGSTKLQGSMQQYSFPIAQLANGVYFVQATQEGHLTTSKVVILR